MSRFLVAVDGFSNALGDIGSLQDRVYRWKLLTVSTVV